MALPDHSGQSAVDGRRDTDATLPVGLRTFAAPEKALTNA
jgi:hypothetical protein